MTDRTTPPSAPPQPRQKSFVEREIARRGHHVHKLKAKDSTGRWAYYFVLVEPNREQVFLRAMDGDGMINLESFGRVLASNYGEEPSDETRRLLKERYDFDV